MRVGKPVSRERLARWVLAVAVVLLSWEAPYVSATLGRVVEIEVRWDAVPDPDFDPQPLLALRPGVELTEGAVRRTLSNLQSTGLFSEVEVLTRPAEGGVVAVVVLRAFSWLETVEIAGESGLGSRRLERALNLLPGGRVDQQRLELGREALFEVHQEQGYLGAEVILEVRNIGRRAEVTYQVESGRRAKVGAVGFEGDLGDYPQHVLLEELGLDRGAPYRRDRAREALERLRRVLSEEGHLLAEVGEPQERFDAESGRVDLILTLAAGPRFEVIVEGYPRRRLERRELLTVLEEGRFDAAQLEEDLEGVVEHLQRRGHYQAKADFTVEDLDGAGPGEPDKRLRILVVPGEEWRLESVTFEGNEQVDDETLLELLSTSSGGRLTGGRARLVDIELEADLANLRSFYLLEGFLDVEIGPELVTGSEGRLAVIVPVEEGPRRRVVRLEVVGSELWSGEELRDKVPLERGGAFHPALLDDSLNILRTLYEEEGYGEAAIVPRLEWNEEGTLVDVELDIHEGRRSEIDRVIFRGQRRSRLDALQRVIGLESGEVISRRRLLEAERELYRLGTFSRVDVAARASVETDGKQDVLVDVEEGRPWRFAYGFSYHSEDGLGGLLSLSRVNLTGRGERLQLDARGNEAERRFRLILDQPALLPWQIPVTLTLFREDQERAAFELRETGAQISFTRDWADLRLGLLYDYRLVRLRPGPGVEFLDLSAIDREDREVELSSLTPNLFLDRRDDPVAPESGWSLAAQLEYAFPVFDAEDKFVKLFAQQTLYQPLGRFGTLAASLRLGAIEPLDPQITLDPLVPPELPSAEIPASERFFAGGRTSHRAYERDRLGRVGETLVDDGNGGFLEVGGNGLLVLNVDYRFPISGDFGGLIFFDWGNVWADWQNISIDEMKPGVGFGLRYLSPIGPVRIEMGWKLDREDFESSSPVFLLSFGNPF